MGSINPQGSARGGADIVGGGIGEGPGPDIMAAATLEGNKVMSADGEHVGKISDIMLDVRGGRIAYAVLSEGGFLRMGSKLHAIPWSALTLDTVERFLDTRRASRTSRALTRTTGRRGRTRRGESQRHRNYNRQPYWQATKTSWKLILPSGRSSIETP